MSATTVHAAPPAPAHSPAAPVAPVREPLHRRFARSAGVTGAGARARTEDVEDWLAERRLAHRFEVRRIPFDALSGWSFRPGTGNLGHDSGRFFTVEGLRVATDSGPYRSWQQPVIHQPEVGVLGILAKEFDGVLHFLLQAKMEPGNRNLVQLSPTVQATRSNYTKVHRGTDVPHLERFLQPGRTGGRVLADALQSEYGSWFYRKNNRNMIVEVDADEPVPEHPDFRWFTLGQIGELLCREDVLNVDVRSVLACAPVVDPSAADIGAAYSSTRLLSWFAAHRSEQVHAERVPLDGLSDWRRDDWSVERGDGRFFRVVAVSVEASSREVGGWSQPLIQPTGEGVVAFVVRRFGGVPHVLVHAKAEAGLCHGVELAPTVQCVPENHVGLALEDTSPFLGMVLGAPASRIHYQALISDEGGRFLDAESRHLIVEAPADAAGPDGAGGEAPPGYHWATPAQLAALARHGCYLNVQARSLLAAMSSGAAGPAFVPTRVPAAAPAFTPARVPALTPTRPYGGQP